MAEAITRYFDKDGKEVSDQEYEKLQKEGDRSPEQKDRSQKATDKAKD